MTITAAREMGVYKLSKRCLSSEEERVGPGLRRGGDSYGKVKMVESVA